MYIEIGVKGGIIIGEVFQETLTHDALFIIVVVALLLFVCCTSLCFISEESDFSMKII